MLRFVLTAALVATPLAVTAAEGTPAPATPPPPAVVSSTTNGPSLTPPDGALVATGPAPAAALFYTGDVIGYVDPCG